MRHPARLLIVILLVSLSGCAFAPGTAVPAAGPSWWRTTAAMLGVLAVRLAVGAVVVGVVVCALKGRPLSALAGVLAAAAGWVTFTQAPTSRHAEQVGGLVLGIVLYGGLAALLVAAVRRARPGSRWRRLIQRGGREPMRDRSTPSGSSSS
jgi:hypothetical protein